MILMRTTATGNVRGELMLLSIDTSTAQVGIALLDEGQLVVESLWNSRSASHGGTGAGRGSAPRKSGRKPPCDLRALPWRSARDHSRPCVWASRSPRGLRWPGNCRSLECRRWISWPPDNRRASCRWQLFCRQDADASRSTGTSTRSRAKGRASSEPGEADGRLEVRGQA